MRRQGKEKIDHVSITAILNANAPADELRAAALSISKRQRHPDPVGPVCSNTSVLCSPMNDLPSWMLPAAPSP